MKERDLEPPYINDIEREVEVVLTVKVKVPVIIGKYKDPDEEYDDIHYQVKEKDNYELLEDIEDIIIEEVLY